MEVFKKCAICQKEDESVKFCTGCYTVAYCSVEHQKQDRKSHESSCWPILVRKWQGDNSTEHEMECVATRDIEAGEILLEETPILITPKYKIGEDINCLTCGKVIASDQKCSGCGWPICSKNCEEDKLHNANECQVFQKRGVTFPPPLLKNLQHQVFIYMLRGIHLRDSSPALYRKVMELKDTPSVPEDPAKVFEFAESVGQKLKLLLKSHLDEQQLQDCKKLVRIRAINSFDKNGFKRIYLKASRVNHSCTPNCQYSFGAFPELKIRIKAAIPLKKGEALTIEYYETKELGTVQRQEELLSAGGFLCKCPRCLDPTECGTFTSAVKCQEPKCTNGYYLPVDSLDLTENAQRKCNECHSLILASTLNAQVEELQSELKRQGETMENLERFLGNGCGPKDFFHKNHYVIQKTITSLSLQQQSPSQERRQSLENYIKYQKYFLEIENKIFPGLSSHRGQRLYLFAVQSLEAIKVYGHLLSSEEFRKLAEECSSAYKEALKYYKKQLFVPFELDPAIHPDNLRKEITNGLKMLAGAVALTSMKNPNLLDAHMRALLSNLMLNVPK